MAIGCAVLIAVLFTLVTFVIFPPLGLLLALLIAVAAAAKILMGKR